MYKLIEFLNFKGLSIMYMSFFILYFGMGGIRSKILHFRAYVWNHKKLVWSFRVLICKVYSIWLKLRHPFRLIG